jgi:hypothetical protein
VKAATQRKKKFGKKTDCSSISGFVQIIGSKTLARFEGQPTHSFNQSRSSKPWCSKEEIMEVRSVHFQRQRGNCNLLRNPV